MDLWKRDTCLADAQRIAKIGGSPCFSRREYEDAMLEFAEREARAGESTAVAFARMCEQGDERIGALYEAGLAADTEAMRKRAEERSRDIESGEVKEQL